MTTSRPNDAIPHPRGLPVLGNVLDINKDQPVQSLMELARKYGPIYQLRALGATFTVVTGYQLVNEICDETRFDKLVTGPLVHLRQISAGKGGSGGLFTADTDDPNWRKAHNILMPYFSERAVQAYLPFMLDVAEQLCLKWERLNRDDEIEVPADLTRLTLDTIALAAFNYRFNSFYSEEPPPFVGAMIRSLHEALAESTRLPIQEKLAFRERRQFESDRDFMHRVVGEIVEERRARGSSQPDPGDLLGAMLTGVDKETGETLDEQQIVAQSITFLVAGHETTSGLLSFALYFLLKDPAATDRAYAEVDRVLGDDLTALPTMAQIRQLRYVRQVLNETLRLWPTAPAMTRHALQPTTLAGKYQFGPEDALMVLFPMLHRDRQVWGENAELFDPENFSPEAEAALPPNAYLPFGYGQRSCIGRQFALQEATLVLGMLLQRFELIDFSNYQLKVRESLTLKPDHFHIKVRPRRRRFTAAPAAPATPSPASAPGAAPSKAPVAPPNAAPATSSPVAAPAAPPPATPGPATGSTPAATVDGKHAPLLVLFGSNLGTAEGIAHQIADDGARQGFAATIAPLDEDTGKLPTDGAVVVVTASYNGTPPDNAGRFCKWLSDPSLAADALKGVRYTVFGCGNRDWASTYQAVPKLIDTQLAGHGAERIYSRGEGDARDDFDGQFRAWYAGLWPAVGTALSLEPAAAPVPAATGPRFAVEVLPQPVPNPFVPTFGAQPLQIRGNRELQHRDGPTPSDRSTRHVEVGLPAGLAYQAGDHLGVIPINNGPLVRRVLNRFGFATDALIRIRARQPGNTPLPLDQPVSLLELLAQYVELQDVATRPQIGTLAQHTTNSDEQAKLLGMAGDDPDSVARYRAEVLTPRKSLLDLLEEHPGCALPFPVYLENLPALRPRYYSISSSPLVDPAACSITVGVVNAPARSGHGTYLGVASTYLAAQPIGSSIYAFVRDPASPFRPPADPSVPMIMVGAGTGLAPFRGFLQERAVQKSQGKAVGPSMLFFGCRNPEQDYIYREELETFAAQGITTLSCAFSRLDGKPKCYVQNNIETEADAVWPLIQAGAVIYVCGDASTLAPCVRSAFAAVYQQKAGATPAAAEAWLDDLTRQQRYLTDVWAST